MKGKEVIEKMAKAGFEYQFEDSWDDLESNSITRRIWIETVEQMLLSVPFPTGLYQICRNLHYCGRRIKEK